MKIFVETANIEQIVEAQQMGFLDGINTNPALMAHEGLVGYEGIMEHYKKICGFVDCDVTAEVVATDFEGMILEGQAIGALHYQMVVKIPATRQGVKAIKYLSDKGIRTCAFLVFTVGQAVLAAKAGASYVSPMISQIDNSAGNGIALVAQIAEAFRKYRLNTEVIAAKVLTTKQIIDCIEVGADAIAAPLPLALEMLDNPLTEIGLSKFLDDFSRLN